MNFISFLLVGAGGALGSMLRYGVAFIPANKLFPYHTFIVNIVGSFLIGCLLGLLFLFYFLISIVIGLAATLLGYTLTK